MEPLASKLRPKKLDDVIGHKHLVGQKKPLRVAIERYHVFSFILWGPPGVGKTTLGRIYASAIGADYYELSAVSASKDDIRENYSQRKIGEIFLRSFFWMRSIVLTRHSKIFCCPTLKKVRLLWWGQQLKIQVLRIIAPLLSRCRVFVLSELTSDDLLEIIARSGFVVDDEAKIWLTNMANGDARQLISMLDSTANLYDGITVENLKNSLQNRLLRFDKKGEEHYN